MNDRSHSEASTSRPPAAGPTTRETGWLPDFVYTDEKFEAGLAFFADARGKIVRFSREPADLAAARRLTGQAALPGLVNAHAESWRRVLRGRAGSEPAAHAAARLDPVGLQDAARLAFTEMLLHGITTVAEFQTLPSPSGGASGPEPNPLDAALLRAAKDTGIRIALFKATAACDVPARPGDTDPDRFLGELDALRALVAHDYPGDEIWIGAGILGPDTMPPAGLQAVGAYAHAQRLRVHALLPAPTSPAGEPGSGPDRSPIARLAELGLVDKRFTAIPAVDLADEDLRRLGAARTSACIRAFASGSGGTAAGAMETLLAAGVGVALGIDPGFHCNLLEAVRWLGAGQHDRSTAQTAAERARWFHAATVAGARSLGAPGGALEVGRPADFFTVNLYDPALAGVGPDTLLATIATSLERRAIREVWVGARQVVANGRHASQGATINRFVELQRRLWGPTGA